MTGTTPTNFAYGALLLRVCLGIMYLAHSVILKWMTFTLGGTAHYFESIGLPGSLAYATFFAEMIGGIFLIAGVQTRWVALALMPISSARSAFTQATDGCSPLKAEAGNTRCI